MGMTYLRFSVAVAVVIGKRISLRLHVTDIGTAFSARSHFKWEFSRPYCLRLLQGFCCGWRICNLFPLWNNSYATFYMWELCHIYDRLIFLLKEKVYIIWGYKYSEEPFRNWIAGECDRLPGIILDNLIQLNVIPGKVYRVESSKG